jgi:ATP-dependent DNA helicase RecG
MTEDQLRNIISMGEGYQTEFKVSVPSRIRDITEEVCAFANTAGGIVIIGVNDDNTIIGVTVDNRHRSTIQDSINSITPSLRCSLELVKMEEGDVFIIEVPSGKSKPYVFGGAIYVRIGPNTQKLTAAEEMREFFQQADKIYFDEASCPEFNYETEIDTDIYNYFLKEAGIATTIPRKQILQNLKLTDENNRFKNGAVLFF